jgi:hypothetical protein
MRTDRIRRVRRTRRPIPAALADQRRERPLIKLDQAQKGPRRQAYGHIRRQFWLWIDRDAKCRRCGAPDLAPPALAGSRSSGARTKHGWLHNNVRLRWLGFHGLEPKAMHRI